MVEIKCPFCGHKFDPRFAQRVGDSTLGTIAKAAIFLPWGIKSAARGQGIKCPICGMIIRQ